MKNKNKKVELIAPAGNLEKLKFAYAYGADGAYIGWKKFNLRNMAGNFSLSEIRKAAELKKRLNKKLYLTLNIFPRNEHISKIISFLVSIKNIPLDGIIVSDVGILSLCKQYLPNHEIHISTQANVLNHRTVNAYKKLGARRVVLARELALKEIKKIKEKVKDVSLEIFVHGALCLSYSGRCHLSTYLTGRDANFGECTHSCRWKYSLVEEKRPGEYFPVEYNSKDTFILNPRDLCLLFHIPDIIKTGVDAFKIEGRMKGLYYIASVVSAYRRAIDYYYEKKPSQKKYDQFSEKIFRKDLITIKNRMYTADFIGMGKKNSVKEKINGYFEQRSDVQHSFTGIFIKRSGAKNKVLLFLKNKLERGDDLFYRSPEHDQIGPFTVKEIKDIKNKPVDFGRARQKVWIEFNSFFSGDCNYGIFFKKTKS
ncbi:MAG: U32 family peptidase [Candidatus Aureabacteria bacterium]|nr:U32 family peptidase [Candidatus Auribacterota bacterium]